MRIFIRRLAIFLTLPAALLGALSIYWNLNRTEGRADYFAASLLALWCVFVWGIYWVISPLTKPSARESQASNGADRVNDASGTQDAGWEAMRVVSAGGSLEDAANAIEKMERQNRARD